MVGFTIKNGLVMYKGCIILPPKSSLVQSLLKFYHDGPNGGHSGDLKPTFEWLLVMGRAEKHSCTICDESSMSAKQNFKPNPSLLSLG